MAILVWGGAGGAALAGGGIAFDQPGLQAPASLQVSVPGLAEGGPLPINYTADGRNLSPPVSWTAGPASTRSFAVVMQDADAHAPQPALHWLVYAVPASVVALPRGMRNVAEPTNPLGSAQGRNFHDSLGYTGPRPPAQDAPHHYHLQVFALDRPLRTRPGAELAAVEKAMSGHVVARGDLTFTYATPAPKAPRTDRKDTSLPPPAG